MDAGIYLIRGGQPVMEPAQMLCIKNHPDYNEQWPRPVVAYSRIHGCAEPERLDAVRNDGSLSSHLPAGTPFGLVGASSLYKRESFPRGKVPADSVTATGDPYAVFSHSMQSPYNWGGQGADAGLYDNSEIHAIRILALEPATMPVAGRFFNHARKRMRILGEIPVRKLGGGREPLDPDGNPDTSFLARIPADVAFTFQTIDTEGRVLNMAQTWHQLRPGEVRTDCGGCHAHSQLPTPFEATAAAGEHYEVFDLTERAPLVTAKERDESSRRWDRHDVSGLRFEAGVKDVEYHRDVEPILRRSCVACHTRSTAKPAGGLALDDDTLVEGPRWDLGNAGPLPATYNALAGNYIGVTRYIRGFQSRRSLLAWKLYGRRLDGLPETPLPDREDEHRRVLAEGDFSGGTMPPPEAVAAGKVAALGDEDRRTIVRWIELGCPIDLAFDRALPGRRGDGWMLDDQRPTLSVTRPRRGLIGPIDRIQVGMHDYNTGLDLSTFSVTADFAVDGISAGGELAPRFKPTAAGVWELELREPLTGIAAGKLDVRVKDREGNISRIERLFRLCARL